MNSKEFLADGRLKSHRSSRGEIHALLGVADRNLRDAAVRAISIDLRFQTAYQAVLQLATIVVAASGLRTTGKDHHWVTFEVLAEFLGADARETAIYFDQCRNTRNLAGYDQAGRIAEGEAEELRREAGRFRETVLIWLKKNHPSLVPR